jgi:biotin carboxyl carrier protein
MSSQTKIIKDIMSIYDTILENKNVSEANDVYDNVDFENIGHGNPSSDNINTALLQDVQAAAKSVGLKVDITTAVSGHGTKTKSGNTSRHPSGNAVDIAKINDKAVSLSNRADADKLVAALVSMGYTKNAEGQSNPKSVLTFGFPNHDNHVHISNITTSTSQAPKTSSDNTSSGTTSSGTTSTTTNNTTDDASTTTKTSTSTGGSFAREIGKSILNAVGINEEKVYSSFGDNLQSRYGSIVIPKENNTKIKSPVEGKITSYYNSNCDNQIVIEFDNGGKVGYLEYCGISTPLVQDGKTVSKGTTIGRTDSDVRVTLYDLNKNREDIKIDADKEEKKKKKNDDDNDGDLSGKNEYSKLFINSYRSLKNSFKKKDPKKLKEDIDRIKGLLK